MPKPIVHTTMFTVLVGLLAASASFAAQATPKQAPAPKGPAPRTAPGTQPGAAGLSFDAARLSAFKARSIGPALMSGRVSDIAVVPGDPEAWYVGLATGGVMKTSDGGATYEAIFEKEAVGSVGAVAVSPSNPTVVWVGTGEANDRNSSGWGDGVYRSVDGGTTWAHAGLATSRAIARIAVHPNDTRVAWVAAMGDLWAPGGERGLFKTADGGRTWKKMLGAAAPHDGIVGCGDVALDPTHPDTVYAALYARARTPWSFTYGASLTGGRDVGGIFRSTDGGATWTKLSHGLPGRTGRIGLSVFAGDPRIVYAIVQSDSGGQSDLDDIRSRAGGVFRSEDGGGTWARMSPLDPRAFYFSQIRVDPINDQRVYVLGYQLHVSDDGGRNWREDLSQKLHPDDHALAIVPGARPEWPRAEQDSATAAEPKRPPVSRRLLLGTDGGIYASLDAGGKWILQPGFAAGEYYRITVDGSTPYRIAGGLQDNSNWVGPSQTRSKDGILDSDWTQIGGGDGFYCVFDSSDPDILYAESQGGQIHRFNLRTGERKVLRPEPSEGQPAFRFHWNSPLIGSRHAPGTMYLAGNRVFRLTERAEHWETISPDLSTRDPEKTTTTGSGAENYAVVYTLAESPVKAGMLWAGTDDGKLWVTENDGQTWIDLTANLPAAVKGQWIGRIEPSHADAAVAYLAVDAHCAGRLAPFAFRTADRGRTWQSVVGNLPADAPVRVIREDPGNPSLLFAGTVTGLFVSLDRGRTWTRLGDLPTVIVDDLVVHPRDADLVIATHGRSLYVLDDITPLRQMSREVAGKDVHLFTPRPAHGSYLLPGWEDSAGKGIYRGENPPDGVLLSYWVKDLGDKPLKIAITNSEGQPVANLKPPAIPGFGRIAWDLRLTPDVINEYGGLGKDKLVRPGEYTVTLSRGESKATQKLQVTIAEGIESR
jgi:photosystem II stability/assembly factor-like uncharacterized protein